MISRRNKECFLWLLGTDPRRARKNRFGKWAGHKGTLEGKSARTNTFPLPLKSLHFSPASPAPLHHESLPCWGEHLILWVWVHAPLLSAHFMEGWDEIHIPSSASRLQAGDRHRFPPGWHTMDNSGSFKENWDVIRKGWNMFKENKTKLKSDKSLLLGTKLFRRGDSVI